MRTYSYMPPQLKISHYMRLMRSRREYWRSITVIGLYYIYIWWMALDERHLLLRRVCFWERARHGRGAPRIRHYVVSCAPRTYAHSMYVAEVTRQFGRGAGDLRILEFRMRIMLTVCTQTPMLAMLLGFDGYYVRHSRGLLDTPGQKYEPKMPHTLRCSDIYTLAEIKKVLLHITLHFYSYLPRMRRSRWATYITRSRARSTPPICVER